MSEPVIKITNLTKFYGKQRGIESLDLIITEGEIFGFLGPNGAGKTTTIRLLLNLILPDAGDVQIFGQNIRKSYFKIFRNVGVVPGELSLYDELTGIYFLNYMRDLTKRPDVLRMKLLADFELDDEILGKKIRYYSHGMKQKLGVIQAMQSNPDLLIMDEPSEGLDPLIRNVLYHYLRQFSETGKTIFFSSHNLSEVEKMCNRVGLVKDGFLMAEEPIEALKSKMVRRLKVTFIKPFTKYDVNIPGVKFIKNEPSEWEVLVTGDINQLLRLIAKSEVKNMIFPEASLEDTFLTYYQAK